MRAATPIVRPRMGLIAMLACSPLFAAAANTGSLQSAAVQAAPAGHARTAAATTGLPQRTLRVELRCVPVAAAAATQTLSPGSVVVGTSSRVDPGPVVTLRSGAPRETGPALQVLVANGERAGISLQQIAQQWALDAIWVEAPQQRAATPAAGASAAGLLRRESQVSMRQLEVWPRWPGDAQPVQLWVAARQSTVPSSEAAAGRVGLRVETQLSLPLNRWTPLARLPVQPNAEAGLPTPAQEWQVRVSLEPE